MKKTILIYFAIISGLLFSCEKHEDSSMIRMDLLTESTWNYDNLMIDFNNNLIPDDDNGNTKDLSLKFNSDGTLIYKLNNETQHLRWSFEQNESSIKFVGLENDTVISAVNEFVVQIYQLDESKLIFQKTIVYSPEQLYFEIYKK